jgi:hypothetical protein
MSLELTRSLIPHLVRTHTHTRTHARAHTHAHTHMCSQEWSALINALDTQLKSEVTRRVSAESTDEPPSSSASSDSGGHDPSTMYELEDSQLSFVSEYLDSELALPISLPRAVVVAFPQSSSPERVSSRDTAANPLTAGILPGTMPEITLFSEMDFSPASIRLADAKRAPMLSVHRPALTAVGPAQIRPHTAPGNRANRQVISKTNSGLPAKKKRTTSINGRPTSGAKTWTARPASAAPVLSNPKGGRTESISRRPRRSSPRVPDTARPASAAPTSRSACQKNRPASAVPTPRTEPSRSPGRKFEARKEPMSLKLKRTVPVQVWSNPDVSICGRR